MKSRGWAVLAAWCLALAAAAIAVDEKLVISADLRLFMPAPRDAAQRLVVRSVGESPASRLLLLELKGEPAARLSELSKALAGSLARSPEFEFVANGSETPRFPESLLPYRYLITDAFDAASLTTELPRALEDRRHDLTSPLGSFIEEWLPRDPTLELLRLAERWQPHREPKRVGGVWFTRDEKRALLVAATRAAAFDTAGQARALDDLNARLREVKGATRATLGINGAGYYARIIRDRTQSEATWFGIAATIGLVALLWFAYRRFRFALLGALPLVSGALAGLAAVGFLFGSVHGITLAFGFTLIGVAQDYPVHLFSHLRATESPYATARRVWPPLLTGVASTCIAYLAFLVSGVTGLAQLACLTVTGLVVAALTTRFALPSLVGADPEVVERFPALGRIDIASARLPRPAALLAVFPLSFAAALAFAPGAFWEDDLSRVTPVPPALLRADAELRSELATPDLRTLAVVSGPTEQAVLEDLEALEPELARAIEAGHIAAADHAARYLPSEALQRRRQQALPDETSLRATLAAATQNSDFEPDAFEPFIADVARARVAPLLTRTAFRGTPFDLRISSALFARDGEWHALVSFYDVKDAGALATQLGRVDNLTLLDLKRASEELVSSQRTYIIACLGVATALLVIVISLALRRASRVLRVLAPMVLTTLLIITVLRAAGVSLNLFHLISLILAAGLGLDYALFFEHSAADAGERRRTLHALLVCAISTLLVFAMLAFSSTPILRAIGVTVSIGVLSNFFLALLVARERA